MLIEADLALVADMLAEDEVPGEEDGFQDYYEPDKDDGDEILVYISDADLKEIKTNMPCSVTVVAFIHGKSIK